MRAKLIVLFVIVMLLLPLLTLIGCDSGLDKGVIVSKDFTPAHTYPCSHAMPVGKTVIMIPSNCWVGDEYTLYVRGFDGEGKPVIEDVTVSLDNYNYYSEGDSIRFISK